MKWKDIHFLSRFWKRRRKTSEYPRNSEHTLYSRLWVWSLCLMLWTWALVLGMNVHINKEIFNLTQCLTGFLTDCFEESRQLERLTDLSVFKNRREESNNRSCVCAGQAQGTARGRQVWTHWVCPRPNTRLPTPPHAQNTILDQQLPLKVQSAPPDLPRREQQPFSTRVWAWIFPF